MPGDDVSNHLKPSRSEGLASPDQQRQIAQQTRRHFDDAIPPRPLKPARSESCHGSDPSPTPLQSHIPEHRKFLELEAGHELLVEGSNPARVPEEFVETEYYKQLNQVDKTLHHTIGTGFIRIEGTGVQTLELEHANGPLQRTSSKGNPATNDWIPSSSTVFPDAGNDKPHRSEP